MEKEIDVQLKVSGEWWLLPVSPKFSGDEIEGFLKCPVIREWKGTRSRFFDIQPKKQALGILQTVETALLSNKRLYFKKGSRSVIVFREPQP